MVTLKNRHPSFTPNLLFNHLLLIAFYYKHTLNMDNGLNTSHGVRRLTKGLWECGESAVCQSSPSLKFSVQRVAGRYRRPY